MTSWNLPEDEAWKKLYNVIYDYAQSFGLGFVDSVVDAVGDSDAVEPFMAVPKRRKKQ
jgi:hypothetical protein